MPGGGLFSEIVVEGEDAMDLGARQIELRGDHRDRGLRHVTERLLQCMQDHQRRAFELRVAGDDLGAARGIPHKRPSLVRLRSSVL